MTTLHALRDPLMTTDQRQGLFYGLLAYGLWGLVPIYFKQLGKISLMEVLLHRMIWCAVFLAAIVTLARRWGDVLRVFRTPRLLGALTVSAALISANWLLYITCVEMNQIAEASLGYFITPLLSVLIGFLFLREHVRPLQWLALGVAAGGVVWLVIARGEIPWLGLFMAISFSLYGVVRKFAPVDGLLGLTIETLVMSPIAVVALAILHHGDGLVFGSEGWRNDLLLAASGLVTALPLLAFGQAARRLPLSSLGFIQFSSPTIQLLIGVLAYGEPFADRAIGFSIVWLGVAVFLLDLWRAHWPASEIPMEPD